MGIPQSHARTHELRALSNIAQRWHAAAPPPVARNNEAEERKEVATRIRIRPDRKGKGKGKRR